MEKEAARKDAALRRLLRKANGLEDTVAEGLAANIATDRARVAAMGTRAELRTVRPQTYGKVIGYLLNIAKLEVRLATSADPEAAAAGEASTDALVATLLTVTATTSKNELRAAKRHFAEVRDLVHEATPDDSDHNDEGDDEGDEDEEEADEDEHGADPGHP